MAGRPREPVTVLSIASSDSGGGAGIQADLLTFAAHGVHGATAIVAATAQNSRRVAAIEPLSPRFLRRQIDAVFSDFDVQAVKIGMLFDAAHIAAVAAGLKRWKARRVVLDPVLCDLVTPNLPEAEALTGLRVRDELDRRLAAGILADLGARAVLIKDGHGRGREVRDLLFDGEAFTVFAAPRLNTRATHGTGCTLSSAIAANLALGESLALAVERAIAYLRAGLEAGTFPGGGFGVPAHFPPRAGGRRSV